MSRIDILMATYNGAQYIDKQLLSIIAQTHTDWQLFIHDDGSNDNTIAIIKKFSKIDNRISLLKDDYSFREAGLHFMYMLQFANSPFICFCDQDDIWLENKLECMLSVIESKDNQIPQVVFSDAYLFHSTTNLINGHLLFTKPYSLKEILFTNGGIHGSASIFNQAMKKSIDRNYSYISMHDHILTLAGCSFGEITYIDKKLFLYRQHQKNVTGNMEISIFKRFVKTFNPSRKSPTLLSNTIKGIEAFAIAHKTDLSENDKSIINDFLSLSQFNILRIAWKVYRKGYSINNSRMQLLIKILTRKFIDVK